MRFLASLDHKNSFVLSLSRWWNFQSAMKSEDSHDDILQAVRAFTKLVTTGQNKSSRRRRFAYLRRNGASWPRQSCGSCWFKHEEEEEDEEEDVGIKAHGIEADGAAPVPEHSSNVEALQDQLAKLQRTVEKKFVAFPNYIDRRFAHIESRLQDDAAGAGVDLSCKVDALADAVFKNEHVIIQLVRSDGQVDD